MHEDLFLSVISTEDACQIQCVVTVKEKTEKLRSTVKSQKTAQPWVVYMQMVAVFKEMP